MLPRLPHDSGSSVGVRETASLGALPLAWILLVPRLRTPHCGAGTGQMPDGGRDRAELSKSHPLSGPKATIAKGS